MTLPTISFTDFLRNPIVGLLFMCLLAIGYLYVDNKSTLTNQIEELQKEVITLKKDYKELNDKFIEMIQKANENKNEQ